MSTIIARPSPEAHPDRDAAARDRAARLAKATTDQMQAALAFLSMIDPEAFEIAMTAATPDHDGDPEGVEPIPLCASCGAPVAIFPDQDLTWRHYRGTPSLSGPHHPNDPGHTPEPAWYLEAEAAEQF